MLTKLQEEAKQERRKKDRVSRVLLPGECLCSVVQSICQHNLLLLLFLSSHSCCCFSHVSLVVGLVACSLARFPPPSPAPCLPHPWSRHPPRGLKHHFFIAYPVSYVQWSQLYKLQNGAFSYILERLFFLLIFLLEVVSATHLVGTRSDTWNHSWPVQRSDALTSCLKRPCMTTCV